VTDSNSEAGRGATWKASSVREGGAPPIPRRVWILGQDEARIARAVAAIEAAGHRVRVNEPGGELATVVREFRPDVIVVDMRDSPERGRHAAVQLRADRATRQIPVILTGLKGEEATKSDRAVTGPTRRYVGDLDAPSVLNAIVADL
jgi:CheY-like chemotaxis protein